jgi:hypothetical protein
MARPLRDFSVSRTDHFAALCAALWAERDVLQRIAGAIVVERITGSADQPASGVLDRLAMQDVLRAAMVESLAASSALPVSATLPALVAAAPEPWSTMLADHGAALRDLLADVNLLGGVRQNSLAEFLG